MEEPPGWVDLHARLTPRGSGLTDALAHLEWAARAGARRLYVPAAPDPARRQATGQASERLRVAAGALGLSVRVEPLPYLPLERSAALGPGELAGLTVPGTNVVCLTLPRTKELKSPARRVGRLWRLGFVPAVFGPEAHPEVQRLPELVRYLLQVGALLVLDAANLVGYHGEGARVTARRLQRLGYYTLVAGYVGHPRGPIPMDAVRAELERVVPWRGQATRAYDELLWGRAARLVGEVP